MNSDWMSLANFTKVEIGAFGMHTLNNHQFRDGI